MSAGKEEFPEPGDLVIATVKTVMPYGVYVTLDEHGDKEGLVHISEVSSTWVKNIRDHMREGQKVVLKVLRVDTEKKHVDLSLRRVSGPEKKEKLLKWKHDRKAEFILKITAEKLHTPPEKLYEEVGVKIEEVYGGLYEGLEESSEHGAEALARADVPGKIAKILAEVAKMKIKIPKVTIRAILELTCTRPNGVEVIKEALLNAKKMKKPEDAEVEISVIAAPRYSVEAQARSYKEAEDLLQRVLETAVQAVEKNGGKGTFKRE